MDEQAYRKLVIKLRTHQDGWFRTHTPSDLIEAKKLEKVLDAENRRWLDEQKKVRPTAEPKQENLFTGE
jgi:hypothetical protein